MNAASGQREDLTSTIHLTSLRSVQGPVQELLVKSDPEVLNVLNQLDSSAAMLVVLIGPNKGARFLLDQAVSKIGRSPESEIFLDDVTVSRKHCVIEKVSGTGKNNYFLSDQGSLNGTYLNGEISSRSELKDGDEVQIGKFRMHFFSGGKTRS